MKHQQPYRMKGASPAAGAPSASSWVSYEDFLAQSQWTLAEWVDGRVIELTSPSRIHQELAGFLNTILKFYLDLHQQGGILLPAFQMKTGANLPGRQPDLIYVSPTSADRIHKNHLQGPADLAIEIISPESRNRDQKEKFKEYERGGVCEYWLIDPARRNAHFFQLGDDGRYHKAALRDHSIYRSAVLNGLRVDVNWLWQNPLPSVLSILKEWQLP